jgi:hypothetical protein
VVVEAAAAAVEAVEAVVKVAEVSFIPRKMTRGSTKRQSPPS